MEERNYTVYKHTSPSGKVYIGITSLKVKERWDCGRGYKKNRYFNNSIKKYGWENIVHEILFENLTKNEAETKEIELIAYYKSMNISYNIENGGNSVGTHSEETKRKIRESLKGRINYWCIGTKASEETRKKMSEAHKGKLIGKYTGSKSAKARKIDMFSLNGEYIKTFGSSVEAMDEIGTNYTGIIKCCNMQQKSCGGYLWRYHSDSYERLEAYIKQPSRGNKGKGKHIYQCDKNNNVIKEWISAEEAASVLNLCRVSIRRACKRDNHYAYGFIWRFKDV